MATFEANKSPRTTFAKLSKLIPKLYDEWFRQLESPLKIYANRVDFLNDLILERQEIGTLLLYLPDNQGKSTTLSEDICIRDLVNVLLASAERNAITFVDAECRKRIEPENLAYLEGVLFEFGLRLNSRDMLEGDSERWGLIQRAEKALLDLLDPETLRLAQLVGGKRATLATYNLITSDLATWQLLEKQAPDLLPLIGRACQKAFISFDANAFRSLKQYLRQKGLREAGWKTLCRMPIDQIRYLTDNLTLAQCAQVANHYAEAGIIPEYELLIYNCRQYAAPELLGLEFLLPDDPPLQLAPSWFDDAASREIARQKQMQNPLAEQFILNEYMTAMDWLRHYIAHGGAPDTHQKKAGWEWIKRQSEAWHEERIRLRTTNHLS